MLDLLKMNGLPSRTSSPTTWNLPSFPASSVVAPALQLAGDERLGGRERRARRGPSVFQSTMLSITPDLMYGLTHVRQRQPGHLHVRAARLLHRLGRARHRRRRDRHDQLHLRIDLEHRLRLGERPVAIAVARPDRHELHLRDTSRQPLFDVLDPFVLVRRAEARGDDRELALAAHDARRLVRQRVADPLRRRLVDEEVARVLLRVGVPRHDLDAALARLAQHRRDGRLVLDAHRDRVDAARDPRFDDLVLLRRIELGRAVPEQLDAQLAAPPPRRPCGS